MFILFETDAWITRSSMKVIGIFETEELLMYELVKNEKDLSDNDIENLKNIQQTQSREINFIIEEIEINTIIK